MGVARVDRLTDEQRSRMDTHADRWIDIGLCSEPADRERFEAAAQDCYRFAGIPWPDVVVWVPSPLVLALAAPVAAIELSGAVDDAVDGAVDDAVDDAVRGAVGGAVGGAVRDAVRGAVDDAVRDAVRGAVGGAVRDAVRGAVDDAVHGVVRGAVDNVVRDAVRGAVDDAVRGVVGWYRYIGGQFWAGGWGYGGAWTSYFREVCGLDLDGDLWDRALAYEATIESACWWWPHRHFVMAVERPTEIHREAIIPRGWGSHRLHRADGPAVVWPDGWGVYVWHGVRVPADLLDGWDHKRILAEPNAEIRRAAIEVVGWDRFVADAGLSIVSGADDPGNPGQRLELYDVPTHVYDAPVRVLLCTNGSPERSGERHRFGLTVPADIDDAVAAAGWTYDLSRDEYAGMARRT